MSFFTLLSEVHPDIEQRVLAAFTSAKTANNGRFIFDNWLLDEAARRATKGKMMRGGLVIGTYEAFGGTNRRAAVQAAAALELYGTGILMQDDVIDRSSTRRGLPTIHVAASQLAEKTALREASHFGTSCGICVGDILYFLAQDLLSTLEIEPSLALEICRISAEELWLLCLAQLEDARLSFSPMTDATITPEVIFAMLAGKTGRYSVAWPLRVGATLVGVSATDTEKIAALGERVGVLFQLRDDELGLFGDPASTGKSADDDIREGKKTLYWAHLVQQLKPDDKRWQTFGNPAATAAAVDELRSFIRTAGIEQSVHQYLLAEQAKVQQEIINSKFHAPVQALLQELTTFVVNRAT